MAGPGDSATVRKPRADAARNRERLLREAKAAFAERGPNASLEAIAQAAGVGIGTLYRHFPTREALIEAVYRNEADQLFAAAERLAETEPPLEALRAAMLLFVDYMATKHGMAEALAAIPTSELYAATGERTKRIFSGLVERAAASGAIRVDFDSLDLLRALAGVIHQSPADDAIPAARRMVDVLLAGVKAG